MNLLFETILANHMPGLNKPLTDDDKEIIRQELANEDRQLPTWLRGHLMEQVKD